MFLLIGWSRPIRPPYESRPSPGHWVYDWVSWLSLLPPNHFCCDLLLYWSLTSYQTCAVRNTPLVWCSVIHRWRASRLIEVRWCRIFGGLESIFDSHDLLRLVIHPALSGNRFRRLVRVEEVRLDWDDLPWVLESRIHESTFTWCKDSGDSLYFWVLVWSWSREMSFRGLSKYHPQVSLHWDKFQSENHFFVFWAWFWAAR